jgi:hypothetical protein
LPNTRRNYNLRGFRFLFKTSTNLGQSSLKNQWQPDAL